MCIEKNTILKTKDGRKIGNGVVIGFDNDYIIVKTDYGNECRLSKSEIIELFHFDENDSTQLYGREKDIQELCRQVLEANGHIDWDSDLLTCPFCDVVGYKTDIKDLKHEDDCAWVIAKDLSTGFRK